MSDICPHCGQVVFPDVSGQVSLSQTELRLYDLLRRAGPRGLHGSDLLDQFYGSRADGGPLNANKCLHVYKWSLNRKLRRVGWSIPSARSEGQRYRLERL